MIGRALFIGWTRIRAVASVHPTNGGIPTRAGASVSTSVLAPVRNIGAPIDVPADAKYQLSKGIPSSLGIGGAAQAGTGTLRPVDANATPRSANMVRIL